MAFRTVFIKNGERLSLRLDNLVVVKNQEELYIPLIDIENIILEGEQTTITSRVLAKLSYYNIDVIICDSHYLPCGVYLPLGQYHHATKRNIWQAGWSDDLKDTAWMNVVSQKIFNQILVSEDLSEDHDRIDKMIGLADNITPGDKTNREGHVAKLYFNSLYGLGFTREDDSFPNACMNYGYSILRSQVARYVSGQGLIPSLGIFHKNEYNAFNLVDDLMEPFRPLLDWYIHRKILVEKPQYLTYEHRIMLIDFLNQQIKVR
ncbi:type II CRISPR-associated endonuclease Cas1 [Aerococcus urinaeequi]|uniref:type II CRISPR-associated endonuclease Cas1 n=1 Tax=Aerococcus urinaeequi TaxID=51665 RepID=UPI003D6A13B0